MRLNNSPTRCADAWPDVEFARVHCLDACTYESNKEIRMIVFDELGVAPMAASAIDASGREHAKGAKLESDRPPFPSAAANKISPIQAECNGKKVGDGRSPPFTSEASTLWNWSLGLSLGPSTTPSLCSRGCAEDALLPSLLVTSVTVRH